MTFVIHPLTQQSGEPKYTAADFRLTVSNFLTAGTSEAFGAVQGVRSDSSSPHASMAGSTITVHPHSGIIAPWSGVGAYAYAITSDITVPRPTTGDYFVVLVVEDPSQSHGSEPQGRVDLIPASTSRTAIDGLVIARTQGSAINDIATRLRNGTVIEAVSKAELDLIKPTPRTRAWVRFGDAPGEYEYDGSKWVSLEPKVKSYYGTKTVNLGTGDHGYALLSAAETKALLGHIPNTHSTLVQAMITDVMGAFILGTYLDSTGAVNILYRCDKAATFRVTYVFTEWVG